MFCFSGLVLQKQWLSIGVKNCFPGHVIPQDSRRLVFNCMKCCGVESWHLLSCCMAECHLHRVGSPLLLADLRALFFLAKAI